MPYIKERCVAGETIEICKRYSTRYGKKYIQRRDNENKTPEAVKKVNQRNAEKNLRRIINANFKKNDLHLVFTYEKDKRPTPEGAKADLRNLMRRMKRIYEKAGLEFKYINSTEFGKRGAVHFHVLVPFIDMRLINDTWENGKIRPTMLDGRKNHAKLAHYIVEETSARLKRDGITGKRYNASRNLIKPQQRKKVEKPDFFREEPVAEKGYYIEKDSIRTGFHEVTGMYYQEYTMIRME